MLFISLSNLIISLSLFRLTEYKRPFIYYRRKLKIATTIDIILSVAAIGYSLYPLINF